jgi:hypothetical protein
MAWQLWLVWVVAFIGWLIRDWLDEYYRISIPYIIIASWSFVEFMIYLAERA